MRSNNYVQMMNTTFNFCISFKWNTSGSNNFYRFLYDACGDLVPSMVLDRSLDPRNVRAALDAILEIRQMQPEALMSEILPSLLVKHVQYNLPTDAIRKALSFISDYTHGTCTWVLPYFLFANHGSCYNLSAVLKKRAAILHFRDNFDNRSMKTYHGLF